MHMLRFLSRWRPRHLLAAWSAYWVGLAAAVVTPVALALHRATALGGPPNASNLNLNFSTGTGFTVTVTHLGEQLYRGVAGLPVIVLAICVPPLALWGAWLYVRERPRDVAHATAELAAPMPEADLRRGERVRADE
ncbi:MAG: hypothetical protein KGL38_13965 [Gemmatimonadota bacterium]|nr:hypothetical protein [Gemmatimonadota bacterium]